MQKYNRIEDQITSDEPNKMPMEDLFVIKHDESTFKEEEYVENDELIINEPNKLWHQRR